MILTGLVYALIGVKNQWVHVFLSTAYLASVAVLVLIIYVINPPVSNAVQGAYFVGIFMSGLIFGGGALVFKEVTEGLGCLLGGFCLSMWFLCLKSGGLLTSTGGKAIFIAAFCVLVWSLSFSHYTRAYGLIGSTSFSGSTAFVLGIDCFSKGGLKEFWIYIWGLNDNLFPLNTVTYPITKGTRVEIIVIVLGTIVGIISQIKLWKVVKDRKKQREAALIDDERRRDAVEEALGRHLERQNDRDRTEWERRYGDRLNAKRNTILWQDPNIENKQSSSTSTTEVDLSDHSASKESLEMTQMPPVSRPALYSSRSKRQSAMSSVQPIQEVEEEENSQPQLAQENRRSFLADLKPGEFLPQFLSEKFDIEGDAEPSQKAGVTALAKVDSRESVPQVDSQSSLKPSNSKPSSKRTADRLQVSDAKQTAKKRNSIPTLDELKRRSVNSIRSKGSPIQSEFSQSQEALVRPDASHGSHSRASSVAATMDDEHENFDIRMLGEEHDLKRDSRPPQILISPAANYGLGNHLRLGFPEPPSPSGLSDSFEADPEALVRPTASNAHGFESLISNQQSGSGAKSSTDPNQASSTAALTRGALEKVPSQMSNVVLSYRTNEWAKHIATAEMPVYEEPDPIIFQDGEQPAHLADPALSVLVPSSKSDTPKTPALPSPVTSVAPSETGMKINPDLKPTELARSRPVSLGSESQAASSTNHTTELNVPIKPISPSIPPMEASQQSSAAPSRAPSVISTTNPYRRSFTDPVQQPAPAQIATKTNSRRLSNPMARQPSLVQKLTIDENHPTDFNQRPMKRSSTSASIQAYQPQNTNVSVNGDFRRPMTSNSVVPNYQSAFVRSSPSPVSMMYGHNTSQPNLLQHATSPSPVFMQQPTMAMRSDTRLVDHAGKTHQPLQRNNTNESRRENLMADWRMQLARSQATEVVPVGQVDGRYAQQMLDYEADKMRREQMRHQKARQEAVMDQSMRTQGMIEAHREVLKKMQSKANQKLTK